MEEMNCEVYIYNSINENNLEGKRGKLWM